MKTSSIFTRKRMGLDNNVWLTMLVLIIVSSGLLAYKVVDNSKEKPCITPAIFINGVASSPNKFYDLDEHLFFKAGTSIQADDISWSFGDNSPQEQGYTTSHAFKRTGTFSVSAVVNGICMNSINVTVIKPVVGPTDSSGKIVDNIIGLDAVTAGIIQSYTTPLSATSYDWSIVNNTYYQPRKGKQTTFKFKSGGAYTILLVLDHDRNKTYTKDIIVTDTIASAKAGGNDYVVPKKLIPDYPVVVPNNNPSSNQNQQPQAQPQAPPQSQPAATQPAAVPEKHKINITDKQLKAMLGQVVTNAMHAPDFERYFCSGANTKVYVNNDKVPVSFSDLCQQQLQGKKVEIELAHIVPDPDNPNCEMNLLVKYKKTGKLFGIFKQ